MKKANFIVLTVMAMTLCFSSCGGDDSSSGESPYVSFTGVGYNSGGKWQSGFTDGGLPNIRHWPFASFRNAWTSCIGLRVNVNGIAFFNVTSDAQDADFFYVAFNGDQAIPYSSGNCKIIIRYGSVNSNTPFTLSDATVNITEYDNNVIGGTFSGTDFNLKTISGSFLFENVGDNNWHWATPF